MIIQQHHSMHLWRPSGAVLLTGRWTGLTAACSPEPQRPMRWAGGPDRMPAKPGVAKRRARERARQVEC